MLLLRQPRAHSSSGLSIIATISCSCTLGRPRPEEGAQCFVTRSCAQSKTEVHSIEEVREEEEAD